LVVVVVVDDLTATTATCPEGVVFRGDSKLHVFITADGTDWGVMHNQSSLVIVVGVLFNVLSNPATHLGQ
jgi:hypothetical protein